MAAKQKWYSHYNVQYALNMAGSPRQVELKDMTYPVEVNVLSLDVNDIPEWEDGMEEAFEEGAKFIQKAHDDHIQFLVQGKEGHPPSIFVHCVAGVNRSPFVVVWWLVKYKRQNCHQAWDLVRKRRDVGVMWEDQTLGGSMFSEGVIKEASPKKLWYENMYRLLAKG